MIAIAKQEETLVAINKKILVVDDNIEYCESVIDVLSVEGYGAVGVHNGFKTLEAISEDCFDLVLMDIKMPGMDGIDTFTKLKEIAPNIPTIVMTAFAVEDRVRDVLRSGVFGTFRKPINFDRLFCSIERAFQDGELVMIACNNSELYSGLYDVLVDKGYRVITAIDGEIAAQLSMENKFDIIIMDDQLPDINGTKTYTAIRNMRPDVPVIFINGNMEDSPNVVDQSSEKDVYAYIVRPLEIEHLLEVMRELRKIDT